MLSRKNSHIQGPPSPSDLLPLRGPSRPLQDLAMPWAVQLPDTCPTLKPGCRQQLHNLFLRGWGAHRPLNCIPRSPRPLVCDGLPWASMKMPALGSTAFHKLERTFQLCVSQPPCRCSLQCRLYFPNSPAYNNTAKCLFINRETSFWRSEAICPGLHNP